MKVKKEFTVFEHIDINTPLLLVGTNNFGVDVSAASPAGSAGLSVSTVTGSDGRVMNPNMGRITCSQSLTNLNQSLGFAVESTSANQLIDITLDDITSIKGFLKHHSAQYLVLDTDQSQ